MGALAWPFAPDPCHREGRNGRATGKRLRPCRSWRERVVAGGRFSAMGNRRERLGHSARNQERYSAMAGIGARVKLRHGAIYANGRGDLLTIEERAPGKFIDQHGTGYYPDGQQWDHVPGSTGNIVKIVEQKA